MYYVRGAKEVNSGKLSAELSVRAAGDFCLEVDRVAPKSCRSSDGKPTCAVLERFKP
jgi:hypothetical protein